MATERMAAVLDGRRYKVVWALRIDNDEVVYPCWWCHTAYDRHGYPRRDALPVIHRCPSGGDCSRGKRFVSVNCPPMGPGMPCGFPYTAYTGICIAVDHDTVGSHN